MIEVEDREKCVFGLDIGTRNVVGIVGYKTDTGFYVEQEYSEEHETRAMLDGQIHDIGRVSSVIGRVKEHLETDLGYPLSEVCIAAAGRVLRTVTTRVEMNFDEEKVVTGEDLNTLDLIGIDQAHQDLLSEGGPYKFYCVGYSVMKYYLNGELFTNLEGHKATRIEEVIIVTFLPQDVVDGLYSAVEKVGLSVSNMTLEPIAAINVAIPLNFRMLNIALVDVGAGTSDLCITKDGSIAAYGMIPYAGDELTEVIVQALLVDFAMAEKIKKDSMEGGKVTYTDIMGLEHTIDAKDVYKLTDPVMEKITTAVAEKIISLNGDKPVAACFVVGGGGKVHGFCEALADKLGIVHERVALRGEEVMKNITFRQQDVKKDPLLVTPIGICLNYYEQTNNFIMIRFNGERMKLYDNGHLRIIDAAIQAGMDTDELFPQRGKELHYTVNGEARMRRGERGEAARIIMDGSEVGLNAPLVPNAQITVERSTTGDSNAIRIDELDEFQGAYVTFVVNGRQVKCPKYVEVNGELKPADYIICEGDAIETRSYYTVGQLSAFMDVEVDQDHAILVNNREADMDTLIYENFSIEWTTTGYGLYDGSYVPDGISGVSEEEINEGPDYSPKPDSVLPEREEVENPFAISEEEYQRRQAEKAALEVSENVESVESDSESNGESESGLEEENAEQEGTEDAESDIVPMTAPVPEAQEYNNEYATPYRPNTAMNEGVTIPKTNLTIHVKANGQDITMSDKTEYVFVDIFNYIDFDTNEANGRRAESRINGQICGYVDPLHDGDEATIQWVED